MASSFEIPQDCGKRLIPDIIDNRARENSTQSFVSYAKSSRIEDGFVNISYGQLSNAINACAWWIEDKLGKGTEFQTLAYVGPSDLRYGILTIGAIKAGYKVSDLYIASSRESNSKSYK